MTDRERPEVRVLVVDDDTDSREVTAAFLRSYRFEVEEFECAEDAHPRAAEAHALVTDLTLPGMSGYELAGKLRADERTRGMIIFALSGRSDTSPEQARLFDRIIVKPFDPDALVGALQAATARQGVGVAVETPGPIVFAARAVTAAPAAGTRPTSSSTPLTREQYRALVEHSPTMIWQAGADAKRNYFNETWLGFTGRALAQELGDGWGEAVHPDELKRCLDYFQLNFERRVAFEMEYRLRRYDGVYRTIFDRAVPYFDDGGKFAGFIGSCVEVEDRVQADRATNTFLSMMAHELRNPLTPLRAYQVQLQRSLARGEPPSEDLVRRLARQIDRLAAMVENVADAARLGASRELALTTAPCDLSEIVGRVAAKHREQLAARRDKSRSPTLEFEGLEQARALVGDARRIEQLAGSLVDNAIKFSSAGGRVVIRLSTTERVHYLVVEDQGIGIPKAELASIGRAYFRGSNASSDNYPGLGLGLATAKEIATAHGGTLVVAADRGVTVTVTLPKPT